MTIARNTNGVRRDSDFGLLAIGSSGGWEISIDEHVSDADRWCAQLEGPSVSFSFEIPSLDVIPKMIQLFQPSSRSFKQNGSLSIGKDPNVPVTLVKDDEYDDRVFLVVGQPAHPVVRYAIAGVDFESIAEALRQVSEDIDAE